MKRTLKKIMITVPSVFQFLNLPVLLWGECSVGFLTFFPSLNIAAGSFNSFKLKGKTGESKGIVLVSAI